ncbi:MAG: 16S rRNA (uracil(1498)-N(3))-methyltransferase [Desulfamplus sp.]|nr:16S rRNA (uracil(1498)-N(3))-methyltransferase [Desulfamplus sp.]
MNLILLFEDDFISSDRVALSGRRAEHILKVHRAKIGDRLSVGLLNSKIGEGEVIEINSFNIKVELRVKFFIEPPAPLPITLVVALPRPKMLRRILQSVSSLGVKEIYFINSWRVEKSFWSSPILEPNNLKQDLILGLEQAKDTILPNIYLKRFFKQFVDDDILQLISRYQTKFNNNPLSITAHPKGVIACPQNIEQSAILAMGPEGGFIDIEIRSLEAAGFTTVNLGDRILRLETAIPFILAKLF